MKKEMKNKKKIDELNLTQYSVFQNVWYCLKSTAEGYSPLLFFCAICTLGRVVQSILTTYLPKVVIEKFTTGSSLPELAGAVLLFMGSLALLSGGDMFFGSYIGAQRLRMNTFYMRRFAMKGLTTDYCNQEKDRFRKLQTEGYECCKNNNAPLVSLYDMLMSLAASFLGLTIFLGILAVLNPFLILLLTVTTTGGYFLNRRIVQWTAQHNRERVAYQQRMEYIDRISGDVRSAKDIRLYHMAIWFSNLYEENMKGLGGWYRRFTSKVFGVSVCESGLSLLQESGVYLYLLYLVWNGRMTAADFVLYIGVITGFSAWLGNIMTQVSELNRTNQKINYYRSYLEYPESYRREGGIHILPGGLPGTIELKNVSYRYEGTEEYALRGINLKIRPGEHLAVVGINGAGKTTLVKLICGLTDPTEGQVFYNGVDLREYNRMDYYRIISAVFQQFSIMPVTIGEIVAEAPGEVNRQRVRKCLEQAGLWEKIAELPSGMDSEFGRAIHDDGQEFSGGEIQKLLLARALYRAAPILVLDEPTAALDPIAESRLYESYHGMSDGKTSFFISHRLASTSFCHRILLMEKGVICEEGTHESLLALKGKYWHLFETQAGYYREHSGTEGER